MVNEKSSISLFDYICYCRGRLEDMYRTLSLTPLPNKIVFKSRKKVNIANYVNTDGILTKRMVQGDESDDLRYIYLNLEPLPPLTYDRTTSSIRTKLTQYLALKNDWEPVFTSKVNRLSLLILNCDNVFFNPSNYIVDYLTMIQAFSKSIDLNTIVHFVKYDKKMPFIIDSSQEYTLNDLIDIILRDIAIIK